MDETSGNDPFDFGELERASDEKVPRRNLAACKLLTDNGKPGVEACRECRLPEQELVKCITKRLKISHSN